MRTIHVLIGNSNLRVTNMIELLVRSVCDRQTCLDSTRAPHVEDFLAQAVRKQFDLIVFNPENLARSAERPRSFLTIRETENAIRSIKTLRSAPIVAVCVSPENEFHLSEAGADLVLGLPFNCDDFKSAVSRLILVPESATTENAIRPSFASGLRRGLEILTESFGFSRS